MRKRKTVRKRKSVLYTAHRYLPHAVLYRTPLFTSVYLCLTYVLRCFLFYVISCFTHVPVLPHVSVLPRVLRHRWTAPCHNTAPTPLLLLLPCRQRARTTVPHVLRMTLPPVKRASVRDGGPHLIFSRLSYVPARCINNR